jgi:hypothetical protein
MATPNSGLRSQQAEETRARIEKISRLAKSNDRMIYYYFKRKEQLFIRMLEDIYAGFNETLPRSVCNGRVRGHTRGCYTGRSCAR